MPWYSIGPSSYPDLKGQTQFVNSDRIAAQFLSMCRDYAVRFGATGDRLSANEARRTRARQQELYANYVRTGYPLAAYPYTSRHDEFTHGNAIDVGVTMKNGVNRALTDDEFAWMHEQAELRGFTWTGRNFVIVEQWHIEGATRPEVFPPYPGINVDNAVPAPATTPPKPDSEPEEEDDMYKIVRNGAKKTPGYGAYFAVSEGQCRYLDADQLNRAQKVAGITAQQGQHFDAEDLNTLHDILAGFGVPPECADHTWLLRDPTGDGAGLWTRSGANATRILTALKGVR
jgi:hypothetical protein